MGVGRSSEPFSGLAVRHESRPEFEGALESLRRALTVVQVTASTASLRHSDPIPLAWIVEEVGRLERDHQDLIPSLPPPAAHGGGRHWPGRLQAGSLPGVPRAEARGQYRLRRRTAVNGFPMSAHSGDSCPRFARLSLPAWNGVRDRDPQPALPRHRGACSVHDQAGICSVRPASARVGRRRGMGGGGRGRQDGASWGKRSSRWRSCRCGGAQLDGRPRELPAGRGAQGDAIWKRPQGSCRFLWQSCQQRGPFNGFARGSAAEP